VLQVLTAARAGWATSQVYLPFVDRAHFRTAEHNVRQSIALALISC
jgi:hypothetical protein